MVTSPSLIRSEINVHFTSHKTTVVPFVRDQPLITCIHSVPSRGFLPGVCHIIKTGTTENSSKQFLKDVHTDIQIISYRWSSLIPGTVNTHLYIFLGSSRHSGDNNKRMNDYMNALFSDASQ